MDVQNGIQKAWKFDIRKFRMAAVICVLITFFVSISNTGLHSALIWAYASPMVFFAVGCGFYNGDYFRKKRHIIFMLYGVWFVVCRWLCGDFFMMLTDQLALATLSYVLLMALPFADIMEDTEKRKYLDIICWITVAVFAVVFALIYIGHFRGEQVVLVKDHFEFGSSINNGVLFIKMCNTDDYPTDYIATGCILISLYLVSSSWAKNKKLLSIVALLLAAHFTVAVVLISCRTVLVAVCGGILMILLIFLQRLRISKKLLWTVFILCCVGGAAFVIFGSDRLYQAVGYSGRSVLDRFKVVTPEAYYGGKVVYLSGRSWTWGAAFQIMLDEPIGFFRGFSMDEVMNKIMKYDLQCLGHMHSGFMEALVLTGVPGALAVLAFSVKLIISSVKVFFAKSQQVLTAHKMMVVAVAVLLFMNIFDSLIFINRTNTDVVYFSFALFAGYIFEIEEKWCKKPVEKIEGETSSN